MTGTEIGVIADSNGLELPWNRVVDVTPASRTAEIVKGDEIVDPEQNSQEELRPIVGNP